MAAQSPSEEGQPVLETILQQAQAAAAAQTPTQETPLQKTDLISPEPAEDDIPPPPAYGDVYGEIRSEENGLGTSARVTDDGRFNIRINQVNRRLSQIFTPALHQQIQSVQNSRPPPSLLGQDRVPPLNIVIQVVGSRGDVQPFVALGKVLKDTYGHRVRLATHATFKDFVQENGLEFFSIGGDPAQLMAFMAKNSSLMPGFRSVLSGDVGQRRKDVAEYIQGCWRSCYEAGDGMNLDNDNDVENESRPFVADCIIANPPSFAHIHCAEKLGIPLHIMFTMPYSPTQAFPHPLANIQSSNADPQLTNYISYAMIELLSWQGLGDIINRFRAKCLGLDPVSLIWAPGMLHRLKVPHTYCWSPALIPKPQDWGQHISVSGFYFLNLASSYTPPSDLQQFLDAGPPPVYIGFGSIVLADPDALTELIFMAVQKTGQRVLLSKGWGGMGADSLRIPDGVFMIDNVPHDWLFKHVSCVVHHGGAGTTAAGISAGRPTVVVPFFGDQLFWGSMVARAGAGPDPIPHKQLTADKLADAINFCLRPESLERAKELSDKIAAERGCDMGAQSFHQQLDADRLRCMLAPSRPATWRIKRTQVRLSAFAACTLANAKLLDFHDLQLFRPQKYDTDEGPWDPISGGAAACFRAFSGMATGVAEFPSETLKPLTMARKSEASTSQTSLNAQQSLPRVGSLYSLSSDNSNFASSSMSSQTQKTKSRSSKDKDMLRQKGVHTSKGLGRFVRSALKAPMDISVGFTQGFHNAPKLWGDDTVRPQQEIRDFKSGMKATGREFGYGWYDGVTGIFTQPWNGAKQQGASGFVKGFGKGIGGFVAKPGAALFGILGHTMKGVHKEVQRAWGSNVQNYIVASRVSQGYEEWLRSGEEEKRDVVERWMMIEKYVKRKGDEELVQGMLEAQRKKNMEGWTASSGQSVSADGDTETSARGGSHEESLELAEIDGLSVQETPDRVAEEDSRQEAADHQADEENLRQAIAASKAEAQRHAREALDLEKQLEQVMAQSLQERRQRHRQSSSSSHLSSAISLNEDDDESDEVSENVAGGPSSSSQQPPAYDPREAQQHGQREKTAQERTEEEIVLEYVKKQSLLEAHHNQQNKGKGRAVAVEDEDDEDLQKALKLSMKRHGVDED